MNAATTIKQAAQPKKFFELYNSDIDYSAPLQQELNSELIGSHPNVALHHQLYNNDRIFINCNKNINIQRKLSQKQLQQQLRILQQHQQLTLEQTQQHLSTFASATLSSETQQQQFASLTVNQQRQQKQPPLFETVEIKLNESLRYNQSNTLLQETNVIKMGQEQQQRQNTIIQNPQSLNSLLQGSDAVNAENKYNDTFNNCNQNHTFESSIKNLLKSNANASTIENISIRNMQPLSSINTQQKSFTNQYVSPNNNKDKFNLWGCHSSSITSSSTSTCSSFSSSSGSSSCLSSSSGCSSGGSSSLSPTSSTNSCNNSTPTTFLSHATTTPTANNNNHNKETLGSQTISPTNCLLRELAPTNCDIGAANINKNNVMYNNKNNHPQQNGHGSTNIWSNDRLNQSLFTNNKEALSQFANISNIWQLPNVSHASTTKISNSDLLTDLWNNDNSKKKEAFCNAINKTLLSDSNTSANKFSSVGCGEQLNASSSTFDPAGIWRLEVNNQNNNKVIDIFAKQEKQLLQLQQQ